MTKRDIAAVLEEIAFLLELKGENPFKVKAYATGARVIESLPEEPAVLPEDAGKDSGRDPAVQTAAGVPPLRERHRGGGEHPRGRPWSVWSLASRPCWRDPAQARSGAKPLICCGRVVAEGRDGCPAICARRDANRRPGRRADYHGTFRSKSAGDRCAG